MRTHHVRRHSILSVPNTKGVLGEAEPDATLDAVGEHLAIQMVQCLRCQGNVLKLDKTHWAVLLGAEAKSLVASLL